MNCPHLAAVCCVMLGASAVLHAEERLELTRDEAVSMALDQNTRLKVAAAGIVAAREAAEAADRPEPIRLSLNPATVLRQLTGSISHVLGLSKERKYASRAARHELAAALAANEEFLLELRASTQASYWALAAADQRIEALARALDDASHLRTAHDTLADAGAIPRASVTEAHITYADALERLEEARASRDRAEVQLRELLGVAPTIELVAIDELSPGPSGPLDAVALRQAALDSRPAMRRVLELADAAGAGIGVARAGRRPEVAVGLETDDLELFGVLSLDWPLIDFGSIRHSVRSARASAAAARAEVEVVRQALEAEVDDGLARLRGALARLDVLEQSTLPLRLRSVADAQAAHAEGLTPIIDVIEARLALHTAEVERIDARLDVLLAEIGLERAVSPAPAAGNSLEDTD